MRAADGRGGRRSIGVDVGGTTDGGGRRGRRRRDEGACSSTPRRPTRAARHRDRDHRRAAHRRSPGGGRAGQGLTVAGVGIGVPGHGGRRARHRSGAGDPRRRSWPGGRSRASSARASALPVFVDNDVNALALAEWTLGARARRALAGHAGARHRRRRRHRARRPPASAGRPASAASWATCRSTSTGRRASAAAAAACHSMPAAGASPTGARRGARGPARRRPLKAAGGDRRAITAPWSSAPPRQGDRRPRRSWTRCAGRSGAMIATIVNGLNPEVLLVTGGVAKSLRPLEARICGRAGEYAFARALAATRSRSEPATSGRPCGAAPRSCATKRDRRRSTMKAITFHGVGDVRVQDGADPSVVDPTDVRAAHHHQRGLRLGPAPVPRARRRARPDRRRDGARVHGHRRGGSGPAVPPGPQGRPRDRAVLGLVRHLRMVPATAAHPVHDDRARGLRRAIRPRVGRRSGRAHSRAVRRPHVRAGAGGDDRRRRVLPRRHPLDRLRLRRERRDPPGRQRGRVRRRAGRAARDAVGAALRPGRGSSRSIASTIG